MKIARIRHLREAPSGVRVPFHQAADRTGLENLISPGLDWVIVGGESGPGARASEGEWLMDDRDQCQASKCLVLGQAVGRSLA